MKRNSFLFILTMIVLSSMSLALNTKIDPAWQKIPSNVDEAQVTSLLLFSGCHSERSPEGEVKSFEKLRMVRRMVSEVEPNLIEEEIPALPAGRLRSAKGLPQNDCFIILAGTEQALYRSTDQGQSFRPVLQLSSKENRINYLYTADEEIFAATNSGLFISHDKGLKWEKIFSSADPLARHCLSIVVDNNTIYLGTENGLFFQQQEGSSWQKRTDFLSLSSTDKAVSFLEKDNEFVYVSTRHKLFRIHKNSGTIQEIFSLTNREEEIETETLTASPSVFASSNQIKQIINVNRTSNQEAAGLYLVTTKGIFKSLDQGETWKSLGLDGLPIEQITSLVVLPSQEMWAATLKGIFRYSHERWLPLYKGMETSRVNFLTFDPQGRVYAATDRGIFFMDELSFPNALVGNPDTSIIGPPIKTFGGDSFKLDSKNYSTLQESLSHELSINKVQEMAIRYAEVHPQKISSWRKSAQRRALLPTLSAGLNRGATEVFHWDTGPNPDVLSKGRDYVDWDVSFSWDLGDLIWNPDQTSIDSRSKLMVELREDILDQITRLYFERRRIQLELADLESKPLSETPDRQLTAEKEMRLEELTALIDALTGGEFSRRIQENKKQPQPTRRIQL